MKTKNFVMKINIDVLKTSHVVCKYFMPQRKLCASIIMLCGIDLNQEEYMLDTLDGHSISRNNKTCINASFGNQILIIKHCLQDCLL